jgi:hypothetical protein
LFFGAVVVENWIRKTTCFFYVIGAVELVPISFSCFSLYPAAIMMSTTSDSLDATSSLRARLSQWFIDPSQSFRLSEFVRKILMAYRENGPPGVDLDMVASCLSSNVGSAGFWFEDPKKWVLDRFTGRCILFG